MKRKTVQRLCHLKAPIRVSQAVSDLLACLCLFPDALKDSLKTRVFAHSTPKWLPNKFCPTITIDVHSFT
jgi:hypothetical protein